MRRVSAAVLFVVWTIAFLGQARAQGPYSEIVVFGDSLCDTGNSFAATGIPPGGGLGFPYFQGRFSNGLIWIDYLQSRLGLADEQVWNYAVGGASTGFGLKEPPSGIFDAPPGFAVPTVGAQIETYLQLDQPRPNQLVIVWAGSNDLLNFSSPYSVASNLEQHVRSLAEAGATEFLVPNIGPLGSTPAVNRNAFQAFLLNIFSRRTNRLVRRRLNNLENELGITIHRVNVHRLTVIALIFPQIFGITNRRDAALDDIAAGLITPEQGSTYLYWDVIHPTSLAHELIAGEAASVLGQ